MVVGSPLQKASGMKARSLRRIARLFRVSDSVQNSENASRAFLSRGDKAMFSYRLDQNAPYALGSDVGSRGAATCPDFFIFGA